SIGAILYELLTGRPPFRAENTVATLCRVIEKEPDRPRALNPSVNRDLETICLKCLEKDPCKRYSSAQAVADDLRRWLAHEPIQARPISRAERIARWARRNPAVASLIAVVAVGLLVASLLLNDQRRRTLSNLARAEEAERDLTSQLQRAEKAERE